jgi:hypothetical protein
MQKTPIRRLAFSGLGTILPKKYCMLVATFCQEKNHGSSRELCDTDGFRGLVRMPTRSKLE